MSKVERSIAEAWNERQLIHSWVAVEEAADCHCMVQWRTILVLGIDPFNS